ncbi:uncharacterized protein LOC131436175 isoform X1 [Malaya genurostris]|uniref:uncharacterized protein LOC131436175 isoform X1 n=1 Tax=Malaya genurostris TaxID=325434 RepID=UPI0026F38EF3|nr:uncharacterized protein LOC131436175 isoform X1 [Malaya genurostris]
MNYIENLMIFFSNLSTFYIFSIATSVAVVVLTIYIGIVTRLTNGASVTEESTSQHRTENQSIQSNDSETDENSEDEDVKIESVRQLKSAKLKSLEKTLTDEQREAEKEIEKVQLAAIFDLLRKQNEEFSIDSALNEDELQEQLSLYR